MQFLDAPRGGYVLALLMLFTGGATGRAAPRSLDRRPSAAVRAVARLEKQLNRHARRYGRCASDRWTVSLGERGSLRLERTYRPTRTSSRLLGRAAHHCAVLRSDHRYDRETLQVNAHDLGGIGVSVSRGIVTAYCRRARYACARSKSPGSSELSEGRMTLRLSGGSAAMRATSKALRRLIRAVQRDPRHARPVLLQHANGLYRYGRILRGVGIGLTVAGLIGLGVGAYFAIDMAYTGSCQGLAGIGCALSGLIQLAILAPGLTVTSGGVVMWVIGQVQLNTAYRLRMQAPPPSRRPSNAQTPAPRRAPFMLGWTFRF